MSPEVRFDPETGLAPAIIQHAADGRVLMLGWMNREALEATLAGRVTFFSRSRRRLWEKGESSGNALRTVEVRTDCDADTLLVRALPLGPVCHTGAAGCFDAGDVARPPGRAEGPPGEGAVLGARLAELIETIAARDHERPAGSWTAELLAGGPAAAARKVAEEAVETALAALAEPERLGEESADLLYHLLVLWRACGLSAGEVAAILAERRR